MPTTESRCRHCSGLAIFLIGFRASREEIGAQRSALRHLAGFIVAPFGAAAFYGLLMVRHSWAYTTEWLPLVTFVVPAIAGLCELVTVLPAFLGLRRQPSVLPAAIPVVGVLGGILLAPLPVLNFGAWRARHPSIALAVTVAGAFLLMELLRMWIWPRSPGSANRAVKILVIAIVCVAAAGLLVPQLTVFWGPEAAIETYLAQQTPIGSSSEMVVTWLNQRGARPRLIPANLPAGSKYPITAKGGAAFIVEPVQQYRLVFEVTVEAFYIFDERGRLSEIRVRKTNDSL